MVLSPKKRRIRNKRVRISGVQMYSYGFSSEWNGILKAKHCMRLPKVEILNSEIVAEKETDETDMRVTFFAVKGSFLVKSWKGTFVKM